jgi:hypothetical protein
MGLESSFRAEANLEEGDPLQAIKEAKVARSRTWPIRQNHPPRGQGWGTKSAGFFIRVYCPALPITCRSSPYTFFVLLGLTLSLSGVTERSKKFAAATSLLTQPLDQPNLGVCRGIVIRGCGIFLLHAAMGILWTAAGAEALGLMYLWAPVVVMPLLISLRRELLPRPILNAYD